MHKPSMKSRNWICEKIARMVIVMLWSRRVKLMKMRELVWERIALVLDLSVIASF